MAASKRPPGATKTLTGLHLGRSVQDVETPISEPPPTASVATVVDQGRLLNAWEKQTSVMRELVRAVEKNEVDNLQTRRSAQLTRWVIYAAVIAGAAGAIAAHSAAAAVLASNSHVEQLAVDAGKKLDAIESKLKAVAGAVTAQNEAELAEEEARHAQEQAQAAVSRPRGRRGVDSPSELPEAVRAAQRRRIEALAASVKAQEALAEGPAERDKVKRRRGEVEAKARELDVELEGF